MKTIHSANAVRRRNRSLGARLALIGVVVAVACVAMAAANQVVLRQVAQVPERMDVVGNGRTLAAQLALYVRDIGGSDAARAADARAAIGGVAQDLDQRYTMLVEGDGKFTPSTDPATSESVRRSRDLWTSAIKPQVDKLAAEQDPEAARALSAELLDRLATLSQRTSETVLAEHAAIDATIRRSNWLQGGVIAAVLLVLVLGGWIARGVVRALVETCATLGSASSELLAGTTQQASSAGEQAAAVSETVATIEEVLQTSEQAAQRARAMAESAQRAANLGREGREAVDASISAMESVQAQTATLADNILSLAERAQAIGEIIAAVNDIAEQTNMLALNAGIEAARAGEHGAGFAVVAREIKELADQARRSTVQVRQILGEIQKATHGAVMVAEEGGKSVAATLRAVTGAGETIASLAGTIDESLVAANQITASAAQQATGMNQVRGAMRDIDEATRQTAAATSQAERAAQDLAELGARLRELTGA